MSRDQSNYLKLKAEWYAKLAKEGFFDIEQEDGNLKSWTSSMITRDLKNGRAEAIKSREEYYRAAGQFLWEHKFDSDLERKIWELHANGTSNLSISKTLALPRKGKDTIRKVIVKLAKIMGAQCRS